MPIVIKPADLSLRHGLDLLAALQNTIASFSKKEELMGRDFLNRRAAINRRLREGLEKLETRLTSGVDSAVQSAATAREHIESTTATRRAKVERALTTGLRALPKLAQQAKEKWMGDLQLQKFRAERRRTTEKDASNAVLARHTARCNEFQAALDHTTTMARKGFRGYPALARLLQNTPAEKPSESASEEELLAALQTRVSQAQEEMAAFGALLIPRSFSDVPLPLLLLPILMAGVVLIVVLGPAPRSFALAGGVCALLFGAAALLHRIGFGKAQPAAAKLVGTLAAARGLLEACRAAAAARAAKETEAREARYAETREGLALQWSRSGEIESEFEQAARNKLQTQAPRILEKLAATATPRLAAINARRDERVAQLRTQTEAQRAELTTTHEREAAALNEEEAAGWSQLEAEWNREILPLIESTQAMHAALDGYFPAWNTATVDAWSPPETFPPAIRFGQLALDTSAHAAAVSAGQSRLALPTAAPVEVPLSLTFPAQGSLLFESREAAGAEVVGVLNNLILRLLTTTPPGKLSLTIIDPVGLGHNFAGLMHLADYEESLINRRIWTQRDQTEERLAELGAHIEKVIQMYLRNEYATITEYNAQAGSVAEKYHFLIVADFPASFSETAAQRLQSIAISGPRCGIYTLIHWDQRQPLPDGFSADDLRKHSLCLHREKGATSLTQGSLPPGASLFLDPVPAPELAVQIIHKVGRSSIDSNRVEVPFSHIAPAADAFWTGDTTSELRIPIGRTGATKMQYLAIGKGTRQHALFAGKTGSGKSTLFHVIITNLALAFSPDQVEFYLIDFKKGVEFKCYAAKRLPHARVVAIESDREFALSVLQRVDEELKRRGDLFRSLGVQDVAGYKKAGGTEPMPRSLLIIDEFQEFFVEDDAVAQTASLLFDRIVRQGRAFGIHVLLGSQTLGGAYSLARATLGQMVIRVALQCNEADAYLIMDDGNSAPRLLTRPGEGIYNDAAGALEGNSPFQVVWLPDEERDAWLDKVSALAAGTGRRVAAPIVFEGNAPADLRDNELLRALLDSPPAGAPAAARCWLGAANSIKGPTEALFQRQSGHHLLIVGQREEAALSLLGSSLLALGAQYPAGSARFFLLHGAVPGSPEALFIEGLQKACGHPVRVSNGGDLPEMMGELATELAARRSGEKTAADGPVFVLIHGLHRFKKLRHEDDFSFSMSADEPAANPGAQLNELVSEGSGLGIHLLTSFDSFNNVNRFMNRKALSEFELRVVFQMSANDSASLIESPKAAGLGLHRAIFYNEQQGSMETFRPYALPGLAWLQALAASRGQK